MIINRLPILVFITLILWLCRANAEEDIEGSLFDLSLEDLLEIKVSSVSGIEETIADAPASIIVITQQQIRQRGYHSFHEIFADLPGFDSYPINASRAITAYQRGYRTPFMSKTLFLINGRVQNHLWDQIAYTERQLALSNIERIEVLYGPASVVYGPNAFLGVVNMITKNGSELANGEDRVEARLAYGSWHTKNLDITASGHHDTFSYALSGKVYTSDEPGLDDFGKSYGWLSDEHYGNEDIWGALLELGDHGIKFGKYANPSDDWGIMADFSYGNTRFSYNVWEISEGYGPNNAADKAQASARWVKNATEYALTHDGNLQGNTLVKTLLSYRTSRLNGLWAEASPANDDPNYSYISFSDFDTQNSSILLKQDYSYRLNSIWQLNGGIKFERKMLTKAFDVCGYWLGSICSSSEDAPGPLGFGAGVFDSRSEMFIVQPRVSGSIPDFNINKTRDTGIFVQGTYDHEAWRLSAGLRYDHHSDYGSTTNPRVSAVYRLNNINSIKLLYGEAFQEPSNLQLFGGWNGRRANSELKAETVKNYEVIYLRQQQSWSHEVSLYFSKFNNVVKEEALNAGSREVRGFEYRGSFEIDNFITASKRINGYVYYTYTDNTSSIHYEYGHVNNETGETSDGWFEGETDIGDISPHKVSIGINVPVLEKWNFNLRTQYHGETELYSRNRLRSQGENLDAYFLVNMTFGYLTDDISVMLKVDNLLNEKYFLPGERAANAGNNFDAPRSSGFQSSLIPTPLRSFMLMLSYKFE